MHPNEKMIHDFYSAFQKRDYKTMQQCYANNATFSDPVFENLNITDLSSMWEMFCVKSTDLEIDFRNVTADDNSGSAEWKATYTFSSTGNKIVNKISARFIFENGCIVNHTDSFSFYNWARQAFGSKGLLLGWTSFVKLKVQSLAKKSLVEFQKRKK